MRSVAIAVVAAAALFTILAIAWVVGGPNQPMPVGQGQMGSDPTPPVKGFHNGREITVIHTEASDRQVAEMLTRMMGPKVLLVPGLAEVPDRILADVYVFTNGVRGQGPFGFQPDVFDAAPGDPKYTPLRRVTLVTWKEGVATRMLRSVDEITAAAARGDLTIQRPGIVVNMPFLTWHGGSR